MNNNQKEYLLYPVITAIVCVGIIAFGDWKRDTLESFWWYAVAALIIYGVMALSKYLIWRRKK